jgi:hypothetical protein
MQLLLWHDYHSIPWSWRKYKFWMSIIDIFLFIVLDNMFLLLFPLQLFKKTVDLKTLDPIRLWGLHLCKLKSVYQNDDLHHLYLHPHYWFFIIFPIAVNVKCKKQWEDLKEQSDLSVTERWTTAISDLSFYFVLTLYLPLPLTSDTQIVWN